jgi:YafQ family addiction module toxin component
MHYKPKTKPIPFRVEASRATIREINSLSRKDRAVLEQILSKVDEISTRPEHYKPLRGPLKGYRRVHLGSRVLLYRFHQRTIYLERLEHHDSVYARA